MSSLRAMINGRPGDFIEVGEYKRLCYKGGVVMSNTKMEIDTNIDFINRAEGSVLINGLGLGMVLKEILRKPEVTSIIIVEQSQDVANLVWPTYSSDPRLKLVIGSAFDYEPEAGARFNYVWHDIWSDICSENLKEMDFLRDKYRAVSDWQGCWAEKECKEARERMLEVRLDRKRHQSDDLEP